MSSFRHRARALMAVTTVAATLGLAGCSKTAPGVPAGAATPTLPAMPTVPTTSDPAPTLTDPSPSPTVTDPISTPAHTVTGVTGSVTAKDFGGIMVPPGSTLIDNPYRIGRMVMAEFSTSNPKAAYEAIQASALQNGFTVESESFFYDDVNAGSLTATKGKARYSALFSSKGISVSYTEN